MTKRITILTAIFMLSLSSAFAQGNWAVGAGASNIIVRGDLVNLGGEKDKFNYGFNVFVDRMFNSVFGLEFMGHYFNMSGYSQGWSDYDYYTVAYAESYPLSSVYFKGDSYGASLSGIVNFTNIFDGVKKDNRKFSLNSYFGFGLQAYNSKLYRLADDKLLVNYEKNSRRSSNASSSYFLVGLGLRYNLSTRFDLELRSTYNFNYEDHLDAAISNKQTHEHFISTMIGVTYKLGKGTDFSIWNRERDKEDTGFELVDSDDDGVIDDFDKDNRTPKGIKVYGDGTPMDVDKDGIPDHKDDCPLVKGTVANKGCPDDTDGDGIADDKDACPTVAGVLEFNGCPKPAVDGPAIEKRLNFLVRNVYFDTDSATIRKDSYASLVELATVLNQNPEMKFYVDGHTDSVGSKNFNQELSEKRAQAIKIFLEDNLGVDKSQLEARGFGSSVPVAKNNDPQRRQLNRRVEIKIKK